jgi:hypothetical protein
MLTGISNFIKVVAGFPLTFWGICILLASMYIAVHYNQQIGYYFAGIGSTLTGITHIKKEPADASNPPS